MWCWMLFKGVGCIERVVFWPTPCWMHFQGVGCIFRVLDGMLDALVSLFYPTLFGGCWMGVGSVNIRIKITCCLAGVGWCWMDKYPNKLGNTKGQVLDEKC